MTQNSAARGETQALSFGQAAAHYDSIRPGYPTDAVRWLLGPAAGGTVIDLGAGTGLLTRVIRTIDETTAMPVEPDALMRAQLEASTPGVTPLAGSAEAIPVPDGSVDGVVAGQAYHWFDHAKAHAEAARVIRRGGVFAPIWNIRDEAVEWVAELTRIIDDHREESDHGWLVNPDFGTGFGPVEQKVFRHGGLLLTEESLVALVASRSYFLTATAVEQAEITMRVRALAARLPSTFELPYETVCYRAIRN